MKLDVSIISFPGSNLNDTADQDINLVKVALLYADKVSLFNPLVDTYTTLNNLSKLPPKDIHDAVNSMQGINGSIALLYDDKITHELYHELINKPQKDERELRFIKKYELKYRIIKSTFKRQAHAMLTKYKLEKLSSYIDNGLVIPVQIGMKYDEENYINVMVNSILYALDDPGSNLIFNDVLQKTIDKILADRAKANNGSQNIKHDNLREMNTSKELMFKLPNLEKLELKQIVTLKGELELELLRFKSLVQDYSTEMKDSAFSGDASLALEKKYQKDFRPQLLELQKQIDKNRFISHLYKVATDNIVKYSVYISAASALQVKEALMGTGDLLNSTIVGAGAAAAEAVFKARQEKKKKDEELQGNKLYFYHKLSQLK